MLALSACNTTTTSRLTSIGNELDSLFIQILQERGQRENKGNWSLPSELFNLYFRSDYLSNNSLCSEADVKVWLINQPEWNIFYLRGISVKPKSTKNEVNKPLMGKMLRRVHSLMWEESFLFTLEFRLIFVWFLENFCLMMIWLIWWFELINGRPFKVKY